MRGLLKSQLIKYQDQFNEIEKQCIELMRAKKPWKEQAKKGAGIRLLMEVTILELEKYVKLDELNKES